jgi:hypothetical protein
VTLRSVTQADFWKLYRALPKQVRDQARQAYRQFNRDPRHPGLQFKRVSQRSEVYSVRITRDYRALGVKDGGTIVWFWIGSHDAYELLLRSV